MSHRHEEQLVSLVFRLSRRPLARLKKLAKRTRINQSVFLREAIGDLLEKYERRDREAARVAAITATHRERAARQREGAEP